MGNLFRQTSIEKARDLGAGTSVQRLVSLPNGAAISRLHFRQVATHATAIAITQTLVEVTVNGSVIISLTGEDVRKLFKFDTGHIFAAPASGTTSTSEGVITFGRFPRDSKFCLPAGLFQNVQLRLNSTLSATPVSHLLDVEVEEVLGVDLSRTVMRKRTVVDDYAASNSQQRDSQLARGNPLGAVFVDYADVDNVDGDNVQLGVNNFSTVIFAAPRSAIEAFNVASYPFDDGAIPTTMFALDMDLIGDPTNGLPTAGFADVKLRLKSATSGVSGNIHVVQEEWLPVGKDSL